MPRLYFLLRWLRLGKLLIFDRSPLVSSVRPSVIEPQARGALQQIPQPIPGRFKAGMLPQGMVARAASILSPKRPLSVVRFMSVLMTQNMSTVFNWASGTLNELCLLQLDIAELECVSRS